MTFSGGKSKAVPSPRELEALRLLLDNYSYKQAAGEMGISEVSFCNIIARLRLALRVSTRGELMAWVIQHPEVMRGEPAEPTLHPPGCPCGGPLCSLRQRSVQQELAFA